MTTEPAVVAANWGAEPADTIGQRDFATFYAEMYPRLARYCYRLVRDEELARDLTQEAFARLFVRWIRLRTPDAYLFHVATNLVRDAAVKQRRERDAADLAEPQQAADHSLLYAAVDRLPRRYREVVLLYYFADLPIAQVARVVRRPEGTVKRHLAEARELLAPELEV